MVKIPTPSMSQMPGHPQELGKNEEEEEGRKKKTPNSPSSTLAVLRTKVKRTVELKSDPEKALTRLPVVVFSVYPPRTLCD